MKAENDWLIKQLDTLLKMKEALDKLTKNVEELIDEVKIKIRPISVRMNPYERTIYLHLQDARWPQSIMQISKETNMGWSTAKKYTNSLIEKGKVIEDHGKYKLKNE